MEDEVAAPARPTEIVPRRSPVINYQCLAKRAREPEQASAGAGTVVHPGRESHVRLLVPRSARAV